MQAGQLHLAGDLGVHDLRADAALAHQQPAAHEVLERPAHGGLGQAELPGQVGLVVQPRPHRQLAGLDHLFQVLRHLEVEGDRAFPVHPDGQGGTIHGQLAGVDSVTIPLWPKVTRLLADQDVNMLRHTLDLTETQA